MKDAQDAYEEELGVRGPFVPVYLWDRYDSKTYGSAEHTCSKLDIENDIDAIKLASMLKSDSLGNLLDDYFQTVDGSSRRDILLDNLGFDYTPTVDELNTVIYNWMTGEYGFSNELEGWSLKRLATKRGDSTFELTDEVIQAVTLAFSEYILDLPNK